MKDFIKLIHTINKLKELKRTGWVKRKVPNPESVADHTFMTAILTLLLSDKTKLDKNKCLQMALIHDTAESIAGDITPHQKNVSKKHILEKKAIESIFKGNNKKFIRIWDEYEHGKTQEAKFVYQIDKMEMLLQAIEYERKYKNAKIDLSEFYTYVQTRTTHPKILEILKKLMKSRLVY